MKEILWNVFSLVCGQNPEHTWDLGGGPLSLCQRCLGLYVCGCVCLSLHWALRPRHGLVFIALHGLLLLVAVPFGFHWIQHGPVLRAVTGGLCGFGIGTFLWCVPATVWGFTGKAPRKGAGGWYGVGFCVALLLLPLAEQFGGTLAGWALEGLAAAGVAVFGGLCLANLLAGFYGFARLTSSLARRT